MILRANLRILRDPTNEEMQKHLDWIIHHQDVPILVAASRANVDYLATLNTHHFMDDPEAARRSGLRFGTPGNVMTWLRGQLAK